MNAPVRYLLFLPQALQDKFVDRGILNPLQIAGMVYVIHSE